MKVIGLIRVSTRVQELESQSIKVKEAILRDGYEESDIILVEDKESGSKLSEEERSGLNKMKHYIETEEVEAVYAYEISRISRKVNIVYSIRDYLIAHNVNLIILNPYFRLLKDDGTVSETASVTFGIFAALSEQETYLRIQRITRGKEKKKAEGKLAQGYPIFGYTVDKNHYVIEDPVEGPIIREIFERFANLESSGSIGKDLWLRNALFTKSDKLLSYQSYVCAILRDKRYAKIDANSIYPALVSKELFNKVQAIRESKPKRWVRKSRTKYVYPLQGIISTEDGYILSPSITNNRYLKNNGASTSPVSMNMKAAHGLATIIMNRYLNSGILNIDREKEIDELNDRLSNNKKKVKGIDKKIESLQEENDRINTRIIKGRISESKGDEMIDSNMVEIQTLEDLRQSLIYENTVINNKLIYMINPMFQESEIVQATNEEELKTLVDKYLEKIIVKKIGHSRYRMEFHFKDGGVRVGSFYSHTCGILYYDENDVEIKKEVFLSKKKQINSDVTSLLTVE